jgi:hypothetical protein
MLRENSENAMSTQKDVVGAMKQQTSGPSRRALIASGVATAGLALTTPAFGVISYPQTETSAVAILR